MHFSTTAALALLPAFGTATRYLAGPNQVAMQANQQSRPGSKSNSLGNDLVQEQDVPSPQGNGNAGNAPGVNDCGLSTFLELTQNQGIAPTVADCQAMLQTIQEDQEWIIDDQGVQVVSFGTCAFNAIVAAGQPPGLVAYLGNADVIDLTTYSIDKYRRGGNVACQGGFNMFVNTAGGMPCDSPNLEEGQQVNVDWTLTGSGESGYGGYGGNQAAAGSGTTSNLGSSLSQTNRRPSQPNAPNAPAAVQDSTSGNSGTRPQSGSRQQRKF